jgi:hypothetical protein
MSPADAGVGTEGAKHVSGSVSACAFNIKLPRGARVENGAITRDGE